VTQSNWGGAREGSGRPQLGDLDRIITVTIAMPGRLKVQLDREAKRLKSNRSKLATAILKRALIRRADNRRKEER
jgi:metal-responsive CopG/Arc/MetJ family transcriptional regulator